MDAVLLDRIVAVIDKEVITWSELYQTMEFDMKDKTRGMDSKGKIEFLKDYEKGFLERMIEIKLILSYAKQRNVSVSEKDIENAMQDIRAKYNLTEEQFRKAISSEGFNYDVYKEKLGEQIVLARVTNDKVNSKIVVTDDEVHSYVANPSSEGHMEQINNQANNNSNNNSIEEQTVSYRIKLLQIDKTSDVTDKEMQKRAEGIYKEIQKTGKFDEIVKRYSTGPNLTDGGDLGYLYITEMAQPFGEIVKKLKIGEVSKPFLTKDSINIIKLVDIKKGDVNKSKKDTVRDISFDEAKQELLKRKADKAYKEWINSLKENSFIKITL